MVPNRFPGILVGWLLVTGFTSHNVDAQESGSVAAQTVKEIVAQLDQEKPDPVKAAKLQADADIEISAALQGDKRADAFFRRAQARVLVGHIKEAIQDGDEAVRLSKGQDYVHVTSRYEQFVHRRLFSIGDFKRAIPMILAQVHYFQGTERGRLFTLYSALAYYYGGIGNLDRADQYSRSLRGLLVESQAWHNVEPFRAIFAAAVDEISAFLMEIRNRFPSAEIAYRDAASHEKEALLQREAAAKQDGKNFPFSEDYEKSIANLLLGEARAKIAQGRSLEAEGDIRQVLLNGLQRFGKANSDTAHAIDSLAFDLIEQGRFEEAEQLTRMSAEIYRTVGFPVDSPRSVNNQLQLARVLELLRRPDDAARVYDDIDRATALWEPARREVVVNETGRIALLINSGKADEAISLATRKRDRERRRSGDGSVASASIRGYLGAALAKAGRDVEAIVEFKAAIPVLLLAARQGDMDDALTTGASAGRNRFIVENYMDVLARNPSVRTDEAVEETFGFADALRNSSVQRALAQGSARAAAKDPSMAELARSEQDIGKQLSTAVIDLNSLFALPPDQRDSKTIADAQLHIAKLRNDRAIAQRELARRFPTYAALINPPTTTSNSIRTMLADDEAFVSFYFGDTASFVWALSKSVGLQFVKLDTTRAEFDEKISKLREALEPQAAMIGDIPAFDLPLAYDLFERLLKPVQQSWLTARNIVVSMNGSLGLLPLSLLPTAPAKIAVDEQTLFASYRDVAWLARTHTVAIVPSVASLPALRSISTRLVQREKLIAFGDPIFSEQQAREAQSNPTAATPAVGATRGLPLARRSSPSDGDIGAELARLPRLPDTADELRSIARALGVDPSKSLHLGKDANEQAVKTANLLPFRFVAFATHGLMAGEIDGVSQPALALSSFRVAGTDGDGLLTMDEILALRLNADWVILSACNTAAGAAAGGEAASGLGRAFFYAGARALLVTNWSVHSQSARELITDLFKRQADDPKLMRAEALRQAMMALMNGPGYIGADGKTEFAYAHPLFWAPYSIIGDGGTR